MEEIWNHIFGTVNKSRNKYVGEEGLRIAIQELMCFKEKNGKKTTTRDMNTISTMFYGGKWSAYVIKK